MKCGLLGRTLGHSYSPALHAAFGSYEYRLYEKEPEELAEFLLHGDFDGLNVTIPYKKAVVPFCRELSDTARTLGSVNTLVRRPDGSLYGGNTDYDGFLHLLAVSGIQAAGREALVFGSGGASVTVCAALRSLGAGVTVISRGGPDNYENLARHEQAQLLVNTTPLGMYPKTGAMPADPGRFPRCEGVVDIVYNPARTAFLLRAEELGLPRAGGLAMLAAQAAKSSELFTGVPVPEDALARVTAQLRRRMLNIVLVGMPGCGKTTVGRALAARLGRPFFDADEELARAAGMTIPEFFRRFGEDAFRALETRTLASLGSRSGLVLATGGGCVTRAENYPLLHQNGTIVWLRRDTALLPKTGRPVSQRGDLGELFRVRSPLYSRFADCAAESGRSAEETVQNILEVLP